MSENSTETCEPGRKFAPKQKLRGDSHAMDQAGEALIAMLNEAATLSNENRERLADLVDDLSGRLEVAQDRINKLQNDVEHFRGRAAGAEKWLTFIQKEIEETLISPMTQVRREQGPPR
jgi:DNA repair exonuclease SbcCD ATPase subunit